MLRVLYRSVLLLVLLTSSSWAQQTADSTVSTAEGSEVGEAASEATAEARSEAAPDTTLPEQEQERVITPPDEYRASEQISDDSSVSFPVDI